MHGDNEVANVNPLDLGNDATSVETAATAFTEMLNDEAKPPRKSESSAKVRAEPSGQRAKPDAAPDADPEDDGQDPDDGEPVDEFLAGEKDTPAGDDDDTGDDDKDNDADADEEADDDADDEGDEGDDDEIDMDREVEVNVAGETQKVKMSELFAGYSREADYRLKTAQLADERREVEEFAVETVAERQQVASLITDFTEMAAALEPSKEDWEALKKSNPTLFIQTKEQWDAIRSKVDEAKAKQAEIAERDEADAVRQRNNFIRSENAKLLARMPILANPQKTKEFRSLILKYGKDAGYTEEELVTGAVDHRDVITLYKAARYDEILRSRKAGQRPAKKEPKPSPSRPRALGKAGANNRSLRDADRKAARSGSVEDAAVAFTKMISG